MMSRLGFCGGCGGWALWGVSHVVAWHPSVMPRFTRVPEHQNVFTVHIRSFLSIPFRINVEDEGYQDLGTPVG